MVWYFNSAQYVIITVLFSTTVVHRQQLAKKYYLFTECECSLAHLREIWRLSPSVDNDGQLLQTSLFPLVIYNSHRSVIIVNIDTIKIAPSIFTIEIIFVLTNAKTVSV